MPHNVKVIRGPEFIRAQPEGRVDLAAAERLLTQIIETGSGLEGHQVLIDIRHVTGKLEPADLWRLAEKVAKHGRTLGDRTAILCPLERFDNTRFFALCVEHRGVNIHAFTDYEAAMEWLIAGAAPAA
jgi:hypothetical protein